MDADRECIDTDVVIVGGGPAGLSCAIHLLHLINEHNKHHKTKLNEDGIIVLEKAAIIIGQHSISGAIMDPVALNELLPDIDSFPFMITPVENESLYYLTQKKSFKLPFVPDFLCNHSLSLISLCDLVEYLGAYAESIGANIVPDTTVRNLLFKDDSVVGVQTEDRGLDKQGQKKANFEIGLLIKAPLTILAEGSHGTLSEELIIRFELNKNSQPQTYGLGFKELWEIPDGLVQPGTVWHSMGYPFSKQASGGSWLYGLSKNQISIGHIVDLNYENSEFDPFQSFQQFKSHHLIEGILAQSQRISYGAKTLPKGGHWSLPQCHTNGALLLGDSAGLVDSRRLKGIHLAIKSGMLAAETIISSLLNNETTAESLTSYPSRLEQSYIGKSLWLARNHQQAIYKNCLSGYIDLLIQQFTHGRGIYKKNIYSPVMHKKSSIIKTTASNNTHITELKTDSLFYSSNRYTENQALNMIITEPDICLQRCAKEYGNPCQYFCPAQVYEVDITNSISNISLNPENCLHCKTCDILDPYGIIKWKPPEGGNGPRYKGM